MAREAVVEMIIAIDGPAGAGKSTIAKKTAERLGIFYLNSGNFYRAVTVAVLNRGFDPRNNEQVLEAARTCKFSIHNGRLILDGEDVEDLLHTDRVDEWVAEHSAIVDVRHIVNDHLRKIGGNVDAVVEGRDISSVVFPDADYKVFLDASAEERAKRRYKQGISTLCFEEIMENIKKRDQIDSNKPYGSLIITNDAFYLDTSDLTIEQVCDKVISKIRKKDQN